MSTASLNRVRPTIVTATLIVWLLQLTMPSLLLGQGGEATITGTIHDSSGAVVPNAAVDLIDQATLEKRSSRSNSDGFFAFTSVKPSKYTLNVVSEGFSQYERKEITVNPNQQLAFSDIALQIGSTSTKTEVTADSNPVPTDTAAIGNDITAAQVQNLAIEGRNVVELLKIVPGAVNLGYSGEQTIGMQTGTNNFAINGIRPDSISTLVDASDVEDPGCNCGSFATPNREFIAEVNIQTSNFGAETVKGPVVFQTITKSGTRDFHGEGYYTVRDAALNSNDAANNRSGLAKPDTRYQYPGFNIGGPVIIPGTNFNRERNKLFFFGGFEWQLQRGAGGAAQAFVPSAAMRTGDFSDLIANPLPGSSGFNVISAPCDPSKGPLAAYCGGAYRIAPGAIDKSGQSLLNLLPLPNLDPRTHNGANFASNVSSDQNRKQGLIRVDYNVTDKMKIYARYNGETESPARTYGLWWAGNIPYPGNIQGNNTGKSLSTSLVNTFSPTLTNEVVVAIGRLSFGNTLGNPKAVDPVAVGFGPRAAFPITDGIVPNLNLGDSFGTGYVTAGGWNKGVNPAKKWVNSAGDNLSVVKGTHLLKFGAYYQYVTNDQLSPHPGGAWAQGEVDEYVAGNPLTTGNSISDLLTGVVGRFSQSSGSPPGVLAQNEISFYGQDSWKASSRLTLNFGVRVYHLGWIYDKAGNFATFLPSAYQGPLCLNPGILGCGSGANQNPYSGGTAPITAYSGLQTHNTNPVIPRSGGLTPLAEFGPRFGFAYDISGKGRTVIRGGWGMYYNHDHDNPYYDAMSNPPLVQTYTTPGPTTLRSITGIQPAAIVSDILAVDPANSNVPYIYEYNFTLSQRLPWQSSMQVSYIGNSSHNQQVNGYNQNFVPFGAEIAATQAGLSPNDNAFRRYGNYGNINYITNFLTANYNGLQVTAQKQTGRFNFTAAYTFSKALGTGTGQSDGGTAVAPTDPRHLSYGPLQYDRTHQAQFSYIVQLPGLRADTNRFARGLVNGWQLSGITILQSGAPLTPNSGLGLNGIDQRSITGSPDYNAFAQLVPGCNPTSNLGPQQLFNAACFTAPTPGHNGLAELPYYIRGPWFWQTDLSLHKSFAISEHQRAEFRVESFNFLNHPLWSQTNTTLFNGSTSGYETGKTGNRVIQLLAKYYF